jgi:hypothetical protein
MNRPDDTSLTPPAPERPPIGGYAADMAGMALRFGILFRPRLLRILRRKWWIVLIVTALAIAAAHLYLRRCPRIYRAAALIEMSVRRPRIVPQQGR